MVDANVWYVFFIALLIGYFLILAIVKNKRAYVLYFVFGVLFGFYFDLFSVSQNYYTYNYYFPSIFGVPLTVTLAEGFSVAITIYLYEFIKTRLSARKSTAA
ncbi:hypothetical protein HYV85_02525 [Candidatus Woesearchaeota archaeon]|nr:hypothetical protein [Candidatus Woesearchaeota archaeon]